MPTPISAQRRDENTGALEMDFTAIPTADETDWILTTSVPACRVLIVAEGVLTIQVRNGPSGGFTRVNPATPEYWLAPTATEWGYMRDLVPSEFRLRNDSGGALSATVILLPGVQQGIAASPAAR